MGSSMLISHDCFAGGRKKSAPGDPVPFQVTKVVGGKQLASHGATSMLKVGEPWRGFVLQGDLEEQQVLRRKKEVSRLVHLTCWEETRCWRWSAASLEPSRGAAELLDFLLLLLLPEMGQRRERVVACCLPASLVPAKPELREHQMLEEYAQHSCH
ncbi:uncharacterized protein LJ264_008395 isoform 2-T2 [Porphyrio hochstetteri]